MVGQILGILGGVTASGLDRMGFGIFDRHRQGQNNKWTTEMQEKMFRRDNEWRDQDLERAERWRAEDKESNRPINKVAQLKEAGLHGSLAVGGIGGGGIQSAPITGAGGRVPRLDSGGEIPSTMIPELVMQARQLTQEDRRIENEGKVAEAQANLLNAQANTESETGVNLANAMINDLKANTALSDELATSSQVQDKLTEALTNELNYNLMMSIRNGVRTNTNEWHSMLYEAARNVLNEADLEITNQRVENIINSFNSHLTPEVQDSIRRAQEEGIQLRLPRSQRGMSPTSRRF